MEIFKKYFIPHNKNRYKPKALCAETAIFILSITLFIETIFLFESFFLVKTDFFASLLPQSIISATNEKRAENGEAILKTNFLLQKAAELKAQDMAKNGYFSHNTPDGKTPWYFLDSVKYNYNYAGENLAINFYDSRDVVNAWFNSETHKENLLSKNYTEIGIGTAKGTYEGKETIFVVQFFASPAETLVRAKPSSTKVANSKVFTISNKEMEVKTNKSSIISVKNKTEISLSQNLSNFTVAPPSLVTQPQKSISKILSAETGVKIAKEAKENVKQIITAPHKTTNYLLTIIFTIVLLALALKIFIKIKIQHPPLIINGVLLLIIIATMLALNQYLILSQGKII